MAKVRDGSREVVGRGGAAKIRDGSREAVGRGGAVLGCGDAVGVRVGGAVGCAGASASDRT